ncbi:MAG TPA: NAD(P)-binding protein [Chitinophagales bacterium]|nr:NAD(P)-binding protein [Chitinophagales bacterium]
MSNNSDAPRKIAVLGGGMCSMTAVYELTNEPDWKSKYDITVYQMGWRLGGKCASGRNLRNADRIEEHGLHLWFGFYDNAFDFIKRVYEDKKKISGNPFQSWKEAFKGYDFAVLEDFHNGKWSHWPFQFKSTTDEPGLPNPTPTGWEFIGIILRLLKELFAKETTSSFSEDGEPLGVLFDKALERLDKTRESYSEDDEEFVLKIVLKIQERLKNKSPRMESTGDGWRRTFILTDLGLANVVGMLRDKIMRRGFDSINDYDYREWIKKHGAEDSTLCSAPVNLLYSLMFCGTKYTAEAGTCLRFCLKMRFNYKGHFYYRMQAGMGDTIFAPLYQVLKHRGVKFKFFHKTKKLKLSADKTFVEKIEMEEQVTLLGAEYDPLIDDRKNVPGWTSEPRYEQLAQGHRLSSPSRGDNYDLESAWCNWKGGKTFDLEHGKDFDEIILGISIGALRNICDELIQNNDAWRKMIANISITPTQAFQIWLKADAREMGWHYWNKEPALVGSYELPFDTYSDMSDVLPHEQWQAQEEPKTIIYFCGPLHNVRMQPPADPVFPHRQQRAVLSEAENFMNNHASHLWPLARHPNGTEFNWDLLADMASGQGTKRFEAQYFRANINPTDQYVLSEKGTSQYRLETGKTGFSNLHITGDWIKNGFNAGCVESCVIAGKLTAKAVSEKTAKIFSPLKNPQ